MKTFISLILFNSFPFHGAQNNNNQLNKCCFNPLYIFFLTNVHGNWIKRPFIIARDQVLAVEYVEVSKEMPWNSQQFVQ